MKTKKERLLRILREGIRVQRLEEAEGQSCEVWSFNDQVIGDEMKKIISEEWDRDQGRLCRWLSPAFGRIAYEVENGGYPEDLAGLDLSLMEELLTSEVEADVVMLREVEKAYRIAFRFVRCFLDEMPTD